MGLLDLRISLHKRAMEHPPMRSGGPSTTVYENWPLVLGADGDMRKCSRYLVQLTGTVLVRCRIRYVVHEACAVTRGLLLVASSSGGGGPSIPKCRTARSHHATQKQRTGWPAMRGRTVCSRSGVLGSSNNRRCSSKLQHGRAKKSRAWTLTLHLCSSLQVNFAAVTCRWKWICVQKQRNRARQ